MYYLQSRYYNPTVGRFVNGDDVDCVCIDDSLLCCNIFVYCQNNAVNDEDPTGRFSIGRTWLALGLDVVLTLVAPLFSGPLDIIGRTLSWYAKKKSIKLIWDKLLYGVVPKFKGLFSKFFTAIRKAIWRVTGSLIANCTTTFIGSTITRFVNMFKNKTWNKIIDFISCFFSAGSMIAGFLDYIDGNFDGRCRLW